VSKRIHRWELNVPGVTVIDAPAWTDLLGVAFQDQALVAWVAQPRQRVARRWAFHVLETGEYVPEGVEHVATAQGSWRGGPHVAHVFLKMEELP
jgi:hypothetical protein